MPLFMLLESCSGCIPLGPGIVLHSANAFVLLFGNLAARTYSFINRQVVSIQS